MRVKLITELSRNIQIKRKKDSDTLYIEGVYSSAELLNNNGRRYKKDTLEREVEKALQKVEGRCLWGELGHPPNPEVNPDKIAILTEKLEWDGNSLLGRSKVLETPMGQIASTLIKEGNLGISSRGLGTVDEKDGYVNDDYSLITWDLVTDPSNNPSWVNGIYEGKSWEVPGKEKEVIDAVEEQEEEEDKMTLDEARKQYHKRLWQVLEDIEKTL